MQTLTISINNNNAMKTLHELEEKHFISIVEKHNIDSPSLPGKNLSMEQFRKWISDAEQNTTVSFEDAKSIWSGKRTRLKRNTI